MNYSVDLCHNKFMEEHKPLLAFDENCDYESWRAAVKEKLTEILGEYERLNNAYRKDFSVMEVRREEETPKKIGRIISRIRYLLEKAGERAGR